MSKNINLEFGYFLISPCYTLARTFFLSVSFYNVDGKFKHDLSKPVGMKRKLVDISKLEELGWRSTTSLKEGVKKTYDFFLNNYSNEI